MRRTEIGMKLGGGDGDWDEIGGGGGREGLGEAEGRGGEG